MRLALNSTAAGPSPLSANEQKMSCSNSWATSPLIAAFSGSIAGCMLFLHCPVRKSQTILLPLKTRWGREIHPCWSACLHCVTQQLLPLHSSRHSVCVYHQGCLSALEQAFPGPGATYLSQRCAAQAFLPPAATPIQLPQAASVPRAPRSREGTRARLASLPDSPPPPRAVPGPGARAAPATPPAPPSPAAAQSPARPTRRPRGARLRAMPRHSCGRPPPANNEKQS